MSEEASVEGVLKTHGREHMIHGEAHMFVFPFLSWSFGHDDWGRIDQLQRAVLLVDSPNSRDYHPLYGASLAKVQLFCTAGETVPRYEVPLRLSP